MEQVVYGDVYFAVNFTMDFLALYLTARGMKLPLRPLRLCLSAALGAIFAVLALLLPDGNPLSAFTTLALPCLLILIAYDRMERPAFFRTLAVFWSISFLLGGAATAVSYLVAQWKRREAVIGGQVELLPAELPFWGLLAIGLLLAAVISLLLRIRKKLPTTATVEIGESEERIFSYNGLVDSGNLLVEPLSGHAVIVLDRTEAHCLPLELSFLREGGTPKLTPRLRLIPYSTATGEGILYGYLPRIVRVNGKPRSACVAIAPLPKGERTAPAILPATLL